MPQCALEDNARARLVREDELVLAQDAHCRVGNTPICPARTRGRLLFSVSLINNAPWTRFAQGRVRGVVRSRALAFPSRAADAARLPRAPIIQAVRRMPPKNILRLPMIATKFSDAGSAARCWISCPRKSSTPSLSIPRGTARRSELSSTPRSIGLHMHPFRRSRSRTLSWRSSSPHASTASCSGSCLRLQCIARCFTQARARDIV